MIPDIPAPVAAVFHSYPEPARALLLDIRKTVFDTAAANPLIGPLIETLKWGEPSYLPQTPRTGTTVRLAWHLRRPDQVGIYLNCKTTLIPIMRDLYPDAFTYQGNRAALLAISRPPPRDAVAHCVDMALTWHKSKPRPAATK
jgi:hypothetical protein